MCWALEVEFFTPWLRSPLEQSFCYFACLNNQTDTNNTVGFEACFVVLFFFLYKMAILERLGVFSIYNGNETLICSRLRI